MPFTSSGTSVANFNGFFRKSENRDAVSFMVNSGRTENLVKMKKDKVLVVLVKLA